MPAFQEQKAPSGTGEKVGHPDSITYLNSFYQEKNFSLGLPAMSSAPGFLRRRMNQDQLLFLKSVCCISRIGKPVSICNSQVSQNLSTGKRQCWEMLALETFCKFSGACRRARASSVDHQATPSRPCLWLHLLGLHRQHSP